MSRQTEPKSIEQGADEVISYQITCSPAPASVARCPVTACQRRTMVSQ